MKQKFTKMMAFVVVAVLSLGLVASASFLMFQLITGHMMLLLDWSTKVYLVVCLMVLSAVPSQ